MEQFLQHQRRKFKINYIHEIGKGYYKAVSMLKTAKKIYIIPITCRSGRRTFTSVVYFMTKKDIFIFDTLKMKVKYLPKELSKLVLSDRWKMMFSKKKTLYLLGFKRWRFIHHICDMEALFQRMAASSPEECDAILNRIHRLGENPTNNTRRRRTRRVNRKRLIYNPLNPRHSKPNQRRKKLKLKNCREIISSLSNAQNHENILAQLPFSDELLMYGSINWAERPFQGNEQIYVGLRLSKLVDTFQ